MILSKWNYKTERYEPYSSPAKEKILFTQDMEQIVECANCGRKLKFGESYTSKTIHTSVGLGYPVCESCYIEEVNEEADSRDPSKKRFN